MHNKSTNNVRATCMTPINVSEIVSSHVRTSVKAGTRLDIAGHKAAIQTDKAVAKRTSATHACVSRK